MLVDADEVVTDSWRIAVHLEARYPDRPTLFGGGAALPLAGFLNSWADSILLPSISNVILVDIYNCLADKDRDYFRSSREAALAAPSRRP